MLDTVPQLLRYAVHHKHNSSGKLQCFYCGASCGDQYKTPEYVLDSFTGRSDVAAPGSGVICDGCVLCLREACWIETFDGPRHVSKAAMRAFSWVICDYKASAGSKAHLKELRNECLDSPHPPFAIVLSDSGKKHLLYRGVVCHSREVVTVTLEEQRITYRPAQLRQRLDLCGRLIAATGKPALALPPGATMAIAVCEYFGNNFGERIIQTWEEVHGEPVSKLATWLSGGRDEQRERYPAAA